MRQVDIDRITRGALAALRNGSIPERRKFMQGYAPTEMRVLGVPVPAMRRVLKDVASALKKEPPRGVMQVARALTRAGVSEAATLGHELVSSRSDALETVGEREIRMLARGLDNWATVDAFAVSLLGSVWRRRQVREAFITRWARSPNRWHRRAAIVATVALNEKSRGGEGDTRRTLRICRLVARDRDEMVAKGLSWALRSLSKRDPRSVRAFLTTQGDRLIPRVRREVRSKLETGLKNPKRPPAAPKN
jgi:3-methyladenine DNA glycosylase AlkD